MRKNVFGRKLKRDINERKALFKNLLSSLVLNERVKTTEEKAKAVKADADKLITKAKYQDRLHAYTLLQPLVSSEAVEKLLADLAPRFADRQGGYTRIIKMQRRFSDNARMAMLEWTEGSSKLKVKSEKLIDGKKETKTKVEATTKIEPQDSTKKTTKKTVKKAVKSKEEDKK
ncbi:MAG TPA: 50S ribosomal protein L17 [Patescibacteria group bacterium]|nr:50S ribosomal protein L17 [Patescibacteria group bacterium]